MYILHCKDCDDIIKVLNKKRHCACGLSSCYSKAEMDIVFSGNAEIFEMAVDFREGELCDFKPQVNEAKEDRLFCVKVLEYLNQSAETDFSTKYPSAHTDIILARKADGATLEDFYSVIDKKAAQWKGDNFQKYLRPKTLFNKTNFQNYIGEYGKAINGNPKDVLETFINTVSEAKGNIS